MIRFRVAWHRAADLVADHDAQLVHGGLLIRVEPPPGLALYEAVEIELAAELPAGSAEPVATLVVARGQVVQLLAGVGVAVAFDPSGLAAMVAAARAAAIGANGGGEPPTHSVVPAAPPAAAASAPVSAAAGTPPSASASAPARRPNLAEQIQLALHGDKDERFAILRGVNKQLHPYVLKNPNLGLDEVLAIAKLTVVNPELLGQIAGRKEWAQRPDIALALVRNPKTPLAAAVKLLDYVTPAELRQLAKDGHTRPQIQAAARKKVIG
jgi:hypothetical protein